jgi:hypothetical protein
MIELALAVLVLWFVAFIAKLFVRLGCLFLVAGFFIWFATGIVYV